MILIKGNHRIAPSVSFQCAYLTIEDGAVIHDRVTFLGKAPGSYIKIGENVWIGQDSILDGTGGLEIGDNVIIGFRNSILTHAAIRGKVLKKEKVVIGSNSWLMSNATVNPGVVIGEGVEVYNNTLITKSIPSKRIVGGCPAKPITKKSREQINFEQAMRVTGADAQ